MPKTTALNLIINDMLRLLESDTHKENLNLNSTRESLRVLNTKLEEASGDVPLTEEQVNGLHAALNTCISCANDFSNNHGKDADPELAVTLRDFQIPFKAYLESIKPGESLDDALNDTSWTSKLFKESKPELPPQIDIPDESREDILKRDMGENLKIYKKIIKKAEENHNNYLRDICNDADHPIDTISYRFNLMNMAIKPFLPDNIDLVAAIHLKAKLTRQSQTFKIDDPELSSSISLISDSFKDISFNDGFTLNTERNILNDNARFLEKQNGNQQAVKLLQKMAFHLDNMHWKPERIGLNNDKLEKIRAYNILSNDISGFLAELQSIYATDSGRRIEDKEYPIYNVYFTGEKLRNMVSAFQQNNDGSYVFEKKNIDIFISSLSDYLRVPENHVFFHEHYNKWLPLYNHNVILSFINEFAEHFPDYKQDILTQLEEVRKDNTRAMEAVLSQMNDMEASDVQKNILIAEQLSAAGLIPENLALSIKAFDMTFIKEDERDYLSDCIDDLKFRPDDTAHFRNVLKTFLIADHLDREIGFLQRGDKVSDEKLALITPGKDLDNLIKDRSADALKAHIDKFLNCKGIKEILNAVFDDVKKLINLPEEERSRILEKASIGEGDLLADVSNETMKVFSYRARNTFKLAENKYFAVSNSDKYANVNRALRNVNALRRNLEDTKPEDYTGLFNALADYVNTRSPSPSTDVGQRRFAAASEMLMKLGLQLREKHPDPDFRAEIDKKLKNSIIRSSNFREDFIKICKDPELLEYASAAALKFQRKNNDVKLDSSKKENEFYEKNKNIHEGVAQRLSANSNKFLTNKLKSALAIKDEAKRNAALSEAIAGICMVNWKDKNGQAPTATELKRRMQDSKMMEEFTRQAANFVQQIPLENLKAMVGRDDLPALLTEGVQLVASAPEQKLADKELSSGGIASDGVNSVLTDRSQFFKGELDSQGLFVKIPKRLDLTVDRNALNSLAICAMLRDGYSLKDILDPSKLKDEKLKAGKEVLDTYRSNEVSDEDLAKYCARLYATGMEKTMLQINDTIRSMKDLSPAELIKPQNRYLFTVTPLLQDMAQELGDHTVIRNTCKSIFGEDHFKDLIDKQFGGGEALKQITLGAFYAIRMAEGKLRPLPSANDFFDYQGLLNHYKNDEELAMNALVDYNFRPILNGIAVQNLAEVSRNQQNNSFNFFNTFKSGTDSCNTQRNSDFIVTDYIENDKNGVIRDMQNFINGDKQKNIQELGKALLSGRLITTADVSFTPSNDSAFGKSLTVKNVKARMLMLPHKSAPSKGRTGP